MFRKHRFHQVIENENELIEFVLRNLASNTLDPMNLTRNESRNTIGPSFQLQFDEILKHLSIIEDEKKKITEQVDLQTLILFLSLSLTHLFIDFSCSLSTSSTIETNLSNLRSTRR